MIRTNNPRYYCRMEKAELKDVSIRLSFFKTPCWTRQFVIPLLLLYLLGGPFITPTYSVDCANPPLENPRMQIADTINLDLTWTSRRNVIPAPVSSGDQIAGDHIVLKAEWQPAKTINWIRLVVNASAIPAVIEEETQTNIAEIDTRRLGNNATCIINVTAGLVNGSIFSKIIYDVFLGNFFKPNIAVLTPNGGEVWTNTKNITWQAWDLNVEESLTFEVLLSSGPEEKTQLLSKGLTQTWLEWDFSGLVNLSTYKVEVRVTDGIYTSSDLSDNFFAAGIIHPTTTSTSNITTTTTTTTVTYDIRVIGFLIALIASSALIALIAYYKAKKL